MRHLSLLTCCSNWYQAPGLAGNRSFTSAGNFKFILSLVVAMRSSFCVKMFCPSPSELVVSRAHGGGPVVVARTRQLTCLKNSPKLNFSLLLPSSKTRMLCFIINNPFFFCGSCATYLSVSLTLVNRDYRVAQPIDLQYNLCVPLTMTFSCPFTATEYTVYDIKLI